MGFMTFQRYLQPGTWSHVAISFDSDAGDLNVYTNGTLCYTTKGKKGGVKSKEGLSSGAWSGLLVGENRAPCGGRSTRGVVPRAPMYR